MNKKLSSNVDYILTINKLAEIVARELNLSDAKKQRLKYDINKIIESLGD